MINKLTLNYEEFIKDYCKKHKDELSFLDIIKLPIAYQYRYGWKSIIFGYSEYKDYVEPLIKNIIELVDLTPRDDIKNIKEIIKYGKDNNVEEIEIVVNKDLGADIGANLDSIGIPINARFKVGSKGETTINIKYK